MDQSYSDLNINEANDYGILNNNRNGENMELIIKTYWSSLYKWACSWCNKKGKTWLLPADAKKPVDARYKNAKEKCV